MRQLLSNHTLSGFIFGAILLGFCFGIVFSLLAIIIKHFLFSELNQDIMSGIVGGLTGGMGALSLTLAKWYWDWADRVMAKFFRSNGGEQEE